MKTIIIFLLTFIGLTNNVFAFPISPRPLRQLVIESQYIIVGYVVKTFEKKTDKDDWGTKVARIAVLENLQGSIKNDTIEIEFNPNMDCPAPAMYFDSSFVIAFVDKDQKSGKFNTHALNYGSKTLKKDEIEIYKLRISEMQQILKISDKENQFTETVEWLVKCTENEATRWEGTFELSPESDFMSFYSQDKKQNFKTVLNSNQKERLKKILLSSNEVVDFGLVDLVYKDNENQIDDFLLFRLKNLKEEEYLWVSIFIDRLKHKNNSKEMDDLLQEFDKIKFEFDNIEAQRKIIEKFIKLIDK